MLKPSTRRILAACKWHKLLSPGQRAQLAYSGKRRRFRIRYSDLLGRDVLVPKY